MADHDRGHGEPRAGSGRPADEMTRPDRSPSAHEAHDLLAVAALAAGDLVGRDLARTELQVAACSACADLRSDLAAIAAATAHLPEPSRLRDFTLSPDDAARLRKPSLRGLILGLAGPRGIIGRPLATAVTSLGVFGIVLASASSMLGPFSGDAAGAAPNDPPAYSSEATTAPGSEGSIDEFSIDGGASSLGPDAGPVAPGATQDVVGVPGALEPTGAEAAPGQSPASNVDARVNKEGPTSAELPGPSQVSPLLLVSIALVALGLALFVLRRLAARLA